MEWMKKWWKNNVSLKVREYVKDYCKRNGLLTLSVFAVVTGCVLGFLLRTLNLSTQVWTGGNLTGGNVAGFGSYRLLLFIITWLECGLIFYFFVQTNSTFRMGSNSQSALFTTVTDMLKPVM